MKNIMKCTRGSLTVEAAIILPFFICIIITLSFFIKVVYVHSIIQHAITETANEIAANGYIYYVMGLSDIEKTMGKEILDNSQLNKESINQVSHSSLYMLNHVQEVKDAVEVTVESVVLNIKNGGILESLDGIQELKESIEGLIATTIQESQNMMEIMEEMLESPYSELTNISQREGKEVFETMKTGIGNAITKILINKHFQRRDTEDVDRRLRQLNVKNGLNGLDFSKSRYFFNDNGIHDIVDLVVIYSLELPLPFPLMDEIPMLQRATVKAWMGGKNAPVQYFHEGRKTKIPPELVDEVVKVKGNIWKLSNLQRGIAVNNLLGDPSFQELKLIDKVEDGILISVVSCNTTMDSYQGEKLYRRIKGDIDELMEFVEIEFGEVIIQPHDGGWIEGSDSKTIHYYHKKMLKFAIPDEELTEEQIEAIKMAKKYAQEKGIELKIIIIQGTEDFDR